MESLAEFLVKAKRATYSAGAAPQGMPSRPASKDLPYRDGAWLYLDSYLGGMDFIGEEVVYYNEFPRWGMNYYGWMLVDPIPDGFSQFLKHALQEIPIDAPFRGPQRCVFGPYLYTCRWLGEITRFNGEEEISLEGQLVYRLVFHGGQVA